MGSKAPPDAAAISTRAVPDGGGWRLRGHKHFISDGAFSDFFVVSAVTDPDAGPRGISLFLVDKDVDGLRVGRDQPMMVAIRSASDSVLYTCGLKRIPRKLPDIPAEPMSCDS